MSKLDERQLTEETGCRIVVRFQWDNATPHIDNNLVTYLKSEFNQCGWFLSPQPANSLLMNVNDAHFFPALAKSVSAHQGLKYKGLTG